MNTKNKHFAPLEKKLVLFGAGKIGRSFIGQLFSRSGYEVVFVDIDLPVIEALNARRSYNVVIKGNRNEIIRIENVRGIIATNSEEVSDEISSASLIALSVGQKALPAVVPLIAKGLKKRDQKYSGSSLDIILAENMRNADVFVKKELQKYLPQSFPIEEKVGLIETSIGKMVPIMTKKDMDQDILQVFAEPYNTLILDRRGFKNEVPAIEGLAPKDNMKAWVDRKLFIHNLGHAASAYAGFFHFPGRKYIYEVLSEKKVLHFVQQTMNESARILIKHYPNEFTGPLLNDHIKDLLERFQNRALGDTVYRVGCDLLRKLGPHDRILSPLRTGLKFDLPVDYIIKTLVYAIFFRATDETGKLHPADIKFARELDKGLEHVLEKICGLPKEEFNIVYNKARSYYRTLCRSNR